MAITSIPLQLCMSQVTMEVTTEATVIMAMAAAFSHAYLLSSAVLHAVLDTETGSL